MGRLCQEGIALFPGHGRIGSPPENDDFRDSAAHRDRRKTVMSHAHASIRQGVAFPDRRAPEAPGIGWWPTRGPPLAAYDARFGRSRRYQANQGVTDRQCKHCKIRKLGLPDRGRAQGPLTVTQARTRATVPKSRY